MAELKSEEIVTSAPLSFHGSAARIWKLTTKTDDQVVKILVITPLALAAILCAWIAVFFWYCTWGLLLVPYRLVRRGSRTRKLDNTRHRELLETVEVGRGK